jgi:peptide subunit release factor 1 (eRF1)
MKDAADFAIHFFETKHIRRILIGGTDENIHKFRGFLPKSWQSLVMGNFPMSMNASHIEVLARAMQVGAEADARRETALIEQVATAAAKAAYAVTGMEETLAAVNTGRVQTLVVAEGYRKMGYRSKENGDLAADLPSPGSADGVYEKVFDVVDQAVNRVVTNGGEVEVIHDTEGIRKLGNIAALLRY